MHKDNSFSVGRNYTPNLKSRFELRNGTRAIEVAREMGQNRQTHGEVFAPHEDNADLGPGTWSLRDDYIFSARHEGEEQAVVPIDVSITVYEAVHLDVGDAPYDGPSYTAEIDSSTYFVVANETVGPTSGIWWGDSEPTLLSIPVIDTDSMELNTL